MFSNQNNYHSLLCWRVCVCVQRTYELMLGYKCFSRSLFLWKKGKPSWGPVSETVSYLLPSLITDRALGSLTVGQWGRVPWAHLVHPSCRTVLHSRVGRWAGAAVRVQAATSAWWLLVSLCRGWLTGAKGSGTTSISCFFCCRSAHNTNRNVLWSRSGKLHLHLILAKDSVEWQRLLLICVVNHVEHYWSCICQSTDADYESVPVEAYGLAMLKGMGWNQDEGIGRTFKQSVLFLSIFQNVPLLLLQTAFHILKTNGQYSIH